jgi:hypothetical protein
MIMAFKLAKVKVIGHPCIQRHTQIIRTYQLHTNNAQITIHNIAKK